MTITMQGSWTLRVNSAHATVAHRFIVAGAEAGNGRHDGVPGKAILVTGAHWSIRVEQQEGCSAWHESGARLGLPAVSSGLLRFDITSDEEGSNGDRPGLVLTCSVPADESDYVLYGAVKAYTSLLSFNPGRDDYLVIDTPTDLDAVCARHPPLHAVIGKLYPQRLASLGSGATPLVIPSGLPNVSVGLVFQSSGLQSFTCPRFGEGDAAQPDVHEAEAVAALQTRIRRAPFKASPLQAGVGRLSLADLQAVSDLRAQAIRRHHPMDAAPEMQLRFQQYQRTASEVRGDAYTGSGPRQELGMAISDERGNYLFRFRYVHDDALSCLRPDVIVQVLGSDGAVYFETAPYDNVANLRRIDLCVPALHVRPMIEGSVQAQADQRPSLNDGIPVAGHVVGPQALVRRGRGDAVRARVARWRARRADEVEPFPRVELMARAPDACHLMASIE